MQSVSELVVGFSHYTPLDLLYCKETLVTEREREREEKIPFIQMCIDDMYAGA